MTTAADIQKQLEELWEAAEPGPFGRDDTIIIRRPTDEYAVRPRAGYDSEGEGLSHIRVLERAKSRVPEWEAVVASYVHSESHRREAYFRIEDGAWESNTHVALSDELVDPVPLVELPEREELKKAIQYSGAMGPAELESVTSAVLELLRGER